jgi:hypothetical protein
METGSPNTELEKLGGEGTGQGWMEVENQEGQGPVLAVAPLLMILCLTECFVKLSDLRETAMLIMKTAENVFHDISSRSQR